MQNFILQLPPAGIPQQAPTIPELPPGPSPERVRPPIEIPLFETWQIALGSLAAVFVVALFGWWIFKYFRRHTNPVAPAPPQSVAIAELNAAAELAADDDGRFAVLSSQALRRYFETGKGIGAFGKTTDEFLTSLETHTFLTPDARNLLTDFLRQCDRVKFAGESLEEAERRSLIESAVNLIQKCEQISDTTAVNRTKL